LFCAMYDSDLDGNTLLPARKSGMLLLSVDQTEDHSWLMKPTMIFAGMLQ